MKETGNEIIVVSLSSFDETDSLAELLAANNISIVILQGSNSLKKQQYNRLLLDFEPDIIHSHALKADLFVATVKTSTPTISTAHNIPSDDFLAFYGPLKGRLMTVLQVHLYRHKFDGVVAVSSAVANFWKTKGVPSKAVHNGLGVVDGQVASTKPNRPLRLVWTGRMTPRKRLGELLQWVAGREDTHISVVGNGMLEAELVAEFSAAKNVTFLGRVQDVTPYLRENDIFVSNSSSEGLPMAVIEAMKQNKTLALSDIPQHRELFNEEVDGVYFFDNKDSFEHVLEVIAADPVLPQTVKVFAESFTRSAMTTGYRVAYQQVLENKQ
jgi:glycosyltransferase involved in cell wall biosynthesis